MLRCPHCLGVLTPSPKYLTCHHCQLAWPDDPRAHPYLVSEREIAHWQFLRHLLEAGLLVAGHDDGKDPADE
jgi:hypothetical protein